jgi:hypothetical protein
MEAAWKIRQNARARADRGANAARARRNLGHARRTMAPGRLTLRLLGEIEIARDGERVTLPASLADASVGVFSRTLMRLRIPLRGVTVVLKLT